MPVRVSCPYCNHAFELAGVPADRRAVCPRCGEAFPLRGDVAPDTTNGTPAPAPVPHPTIPPPARTGWWTLPRVAGVAVAMVLVGFGVGWAVRHFRPPEPDGKGEPDSSPTALARPPAELPGLGFLPADCNIVFAVQPGPVLAYAARTNRDPVQLLTAAGVPADVFAALAKAGVTLQQIDHLAAGTRIPDRDDAAALWVAVALVLRHPPADEEKFLQTLEAKRDPRKADRFDVIVAGKLPLRLARVSPREWVFGFGERSLEATDRGTRGAGHFSADLRDTLAQKIPPDAAVWLATGSEDWAAKPGVGLLLGQLGAKAASAVAKGRAVAAGLTLGDDPRLRLFVRAADAESGEKLRAYFGSKAGENTRHGGAGEWAMYDSPFDPAKGFGQLKGFLDDAK